MKRAFSSFATIALALALVSAMAATAMAQSSGIPGAPVTPSNPAGAVSRFDNGYLDKHPDIEQRLVHDPSLLDNQQYMAAHPHLQEYMARHPEVRTDIQQHPDHFVHAASSYQRYESGRSYANGIPVSRFDNTYLDQHPEVAQRLARNPSLVNNQQFLNSHPGLDGYLAKHPGLSTDLQQHPERFMHAESSYGRWESRAFKNWPKKHSW
jgi:hypothetical protein